MGNWLTLTVFYLIWIPQAGWQILAWMYWWQDKEYRLDRFSALFRSIDGRKELLLIGIFVKFFLLVLSFYTPEIFLGYLFYLVALDLLVIKKVTKKNLRRPVFTARVLIALLPLTLSIVLLLVFAYLSSASLLAIFVMAELLVGVLPSLGISYTRFIVKHSEGRDAKMAKSVLDQLQPFVIAITGSYGKTTTKDFIATLLSEKFQVGKTEESQNTLFGVTRNIKKLSHKTIDYFICEIGAYRKGEIKKIANIVHPNLAVITAIEPQHIELFGNMDNLVAAKYELVESLSQNGTVVFNVGNKGCQQMRQHTIEDRKDLKILGYAVGKQFINDSTADICSVPKQISRGNIEVEFYEKGKRYLLPLPISGVHFVENVTGAILVARSQGLTWPEIKYGVRKLKQPKNTMQVLQFDKATVIDDSHNSTPTAFLAAINYLKLFPNTKKAVITSGIIELGAMSSQVHIKIGEALKKECDKVILRKRDIEEDIKRGMGSAADRVEVIEDADKLVAEFQQLKKQGYVILLEGRLPVSLMSIIENK